MISFPMRFGLRLSRYFLRPNRAAFAIRDENRWTGEGFSPASSMC